MVHTKQWPGDQHPKISGSDAECRAPPPCVPPANGKSPGRASAARMEFLVDFGWELHGSYPTEICRNGDLGWFNLSHKYGDIIDFNGLKEVNIFRRRQSSILLDSTSNIGGSCRFPLTPILGGEGFHQKNEMHNRVYYIIYIYMNMCVYEYSCLITTWLDAKKRHAQPTPKNLEKTPCFPWHAGVVFATQSHWTSKG